MNADRPTPSGSDQFKSLQILDELSHNDSLTQRDLSSRLGIALGLVNSYIKNLAAKGYITVKSIPTKRYAYYLTPKGFSEKTRLTYDLLQDYTRIYREAKNNLKIVFQRIQAAGMRRIIFAGSDEVAEIAYITLQDTAIKLVGVVDIGETGKLFFNNEIKSIDSLRSMEYDCILVASYLKKEELYQALLHSGINKKYIRFIF
jgi:DNA-binding MarR family transcriptional regulator